ncbi:MAG: phospholipase B family protein [Methanoregula sp.]|jgi:hypothetical protein|uniref:C45 family autoproteolytic acyltransferase/hydolase n=1 Tax=Methanoregula sp. TaxID=2052170 RepID=UPI0025CC76D1|nr:C45 family peptidase [Methanoregula sp.]MCK9631230.1 phospholipase B family protein [Methanoregula sp.]
MKRQYPWNNARNLVIFTLILLMCCTVAAANITFSPDGKGYRFEKDGWTYLHIEGAPYERGYQHGYLMASELAEIQDLNRYFVYHDTGMEWNYFINASMEMYPQHIDDEFNTEMHGIADGAMAAGTNISYDEVLAWNTFIEMMGYWWPQEEPGAYETMEIMKDSCTAFIATGDYTKDKGIVFAHTSWYPFERAHYFDLIEDIQPENGSRILMQTAPGLLDSTIDFVVTDAGLMITETTIGGFHQYEQNMSPNFYRMRKAAQYADSLDEFVTIMDTNRSGGVANAWLVGDLNTGEIMRFEQGLKFSSVTKTRNGYFVTANNVADPRIRNFEVSGFNPTDVRNPVGARLVRLSQLMEEYKGRLSPDTAKVVLSNHYDVWRRTTTPSSRSIEGAYWLDPDPATSAPAYRPAGSFDGKVGDSAMAANMSFEARWGLPSGMAFDADAFLEQHPQWGYMEDYLKSFPTRSWNVFTIEDKDIP